MVLAITNPFFVTDFPKGLIYDKQKRYKSRNEKTLPKKQAFFLGGYAGNKHQVVSGRHLTVVGKQL
jgi:hypothetical protein